MVALMRLLRQGGERGANEPHLPFQIRLAELLQPPRRPDQAGFREKRLNAVGGAGPEMRVIHSGRKERDVPIVDGPALGGNGWRQTGVVVDRQPQAVKEEVAVQGVAQQVRVKALLEQKAVHVGGPQDDA
jgi:hypothetical protein